jgi:phosphoserine phosphatase
MGWIAVDLDGTLAEYHGWQDGSIGAPVPAMVERVKRWLAEGKDVRIFTARAGIFDAVSPESLQRADREFAERQVALIEAWCEQHIGRRLPVTASKDFLLMEIWDDRAVRVRMNTGECIEDYFSRKQSLCQARRRLWPTARP